MISHLNLFVSVLNCLVATQVAAIAYCLVRKEMNYSVSGFDLDQVADVIKWPVTVKMSNKDGKPVTFQFIAHFNRLTQDEISALIGKDRDEPISDEECVAKVLAGWDKVMQGGSELPFNPDTVATFTNIFPVRPSIVRAWLTSIDREGKRKN